MKQDRVVVITGTAGGMGSVLVDRSLANDDTVVATDREEGLQTLRAKVGANTRLVTFAADISKEEDCARLAVVARDKAGRVEILNNCAGYFPIVLFEKMTTDQWRQTIDINLTGNFLMTRAMLPLMKGRAWGRIVNFGLASIFEGVPGQTHCVAAKAGTVGLTRSLARRRLWDHGKRDNTWAHGHEGREGQLSGGCS